MSRHLEGRCLLESGNLHLRPAMVEDIKLPELKHHTQS